MVSLIVWIFVPNASQRQRFTGLCVPHLQEVIKNKQKKTRRVLLKSSRFIQFLVPKTKKCYITYSQMSTAQDLSGKTMHLTQCSFTFYLDFEVHTVMHDQKLFFKNEALSPPKPESATRRWPLWSTLLEDSLGQRKCPHPRQHLLPGRPIIVTHQCRNINAWPPPYNSGWFSRAILAWGLTKQLAEAFDGTSPELASPSA